MRFQSTSRMAILLGAIILLASACKRSADAPRIIDMNLDPEGPVAPLTDIHVTAEVEGTNLEYHWTASGGAVREAASHSPQLTPAAPIWVTEPGHDDVGKILQGLPYESRTVDLDHLRLSSGQSALEAIFINSSDAISTVSEETELREWVGEGGALYASGRASEYISALWPHRIDFAEPNPYVGSANTSNEFISADIIDDPATQTLGFETLDLAYPGYPWPPVVNSAITTSTIVSADASAVVDMDSITNLPFGEDFTAMPLAMYFTYGEGMVLYTNFHYHDAVSSSEQALLEYLVAVVLAHPLLKRSHSLVDLAGYFHYADFIGAPSAEEEIVHTFDIAEAGDVYLLLNAKYGHLQWSVNGPGGLSETVGGIGPTSMAFPDVPDGAWSSSVTSHTDFPDERRIFTLSVATRSQNAELITDVPEVIWQVPATDGTYTIKLRVIDDQFRVDEFIVGIQVE